MGSLSYSFLGLICSAIGLAKSFDSKVSVINVDRKSGNCIATEYEEMSKKQFKSLAPKQKSLIKRCDSTLSDLLSIQSDEDSRISLSDRDSSDEDFEDMIRLPS